MLLAVDCSTQQVGLALYNGSRVVGEMSWHSSNRHTVVLSTSIESLMRRCGVENGDLEALAVATGPGSFTSLRIGLAVIKGMSLSLRLPVVGVPTLDFLAASQPQLIGLPMIAMLRAGRGRFALRRYQIVNGGWQSEDDIAVMDMDELAQVLAEPVWVVGELNGDERREIEKKYKRVKLASPADSIRRSAYLAEIAWKRWKSGQVDDVASLAPIYLHFAGSVPA
jgi:tRNA threonylcarbamoyladenosine biosynthesis protein TsaB